MGLSFNLHSGAALKSMMDGIGETTARLLKKAFHGYSSEIVSDALSRGAKDVAASPLNDLSTAKLNAIPAIKDLKAGVTFDSANWTGRGFNGFTKPKVEVSVGVIDLNAKPEKPGALSPMAPKGPGLNM